MMRRGIAIGTVLALFFCAGIALADRADEVNRAIREQGYNWVAEDNEVARLFREQGWYRGGPLQSEPLGESLGSFTISDDKALPTSLDWRDMDGVNYVTEVKNQRSCGSCWAFATLGPMESAIAIAEDWPDPKIDLSEQQMVSCSSAGSCASGGLTTSSFDYAMDTGITTEECFPYRALDPVDGATCDTMCDEWHQSVHTIDDWQVISLTGFNIEAMKQALQAGPIAASIVIFEDFTLYKDGIYENTEWIPQGLHAVTIIGYNDAQQYWIIKNSWGVFWGQLGIGKVKYGTALIGSMSILPVYEPKGLGPEPDDDDDAADDDDDTSGDDDDSSDDDDSGNDWGDDDGDDDDDDDDGGCCG